MVIANFISYILCIIGGLNWGLYGIFNFNLVSRVFGAPRSAGSVITYTIIAIAALWLIISPIITGYGLKLSHRDESVRESRAHR